MYFSGKRSSRLRWCGLLLAGCILAGASIVRAADLAACQKLFLTGNYAECIKMADDAIKKTSWDDGWPLLLAKAQMAVGKYPEADATITTALRRYSDSIPLRLEAYEVYNANGKTERARALLDELNDVVSSRMRYNRDPLSLVAIGRAALLLNLDPKLVLENFYDQAKRADPNCREAYLASGELALDKNDFQLAANTFNAALKKFPDDPEAQFGLARAYAPNDAPKMAHYLQLVLDYNSNHVASLLLLADHLIDAEEDEAANKLLTQALEVNPWSPEAWAYKALMAHMANKTNAEASAREAAFKYWGTNPHVDHLIGRKLSQKYRFAEGAPLQKRALKFDPNFLPAKMQLAQDLMRLGNEDEGWQLAEEVHDRDGYDVTAYSFVTLRGTLAKFQTITNQDFIVRMSTHEAAIYGDRVLALLQRAKDKLSEKYGMHLDQPTTVEIFPEQKDFGVRTFGVAHNPGFLGVCFGHVITANSPASSGGHGESWEAGPWHEFCHVITLTKTHNKMPRWLSEGISVFEERQANPVWGQSMIPAYRDMVLGDDLTPVGDLSSAFMSPKSMMHIQFAYYESSLVVEYIVKNFGLDAVKKILVDLGADVPINEALAKHTVPMEKLEKDFSAFAHDRAKNLAPGLDWSKPNRGAASTNTLVSVLNNPGETIATPTSINPNSTNYWELVRQAGMALEAKKWTEAKTPLKKLIELFPDQTGGNNAYEMLARAHRMLKETNEERAVLEKIITREADATDAFLRLMDIAATAGDWKIVAENAERYLAVNPLVPQPYRHLARASEELGQLQPATRSYLRLLLLDPPDPADVHYRLARLLQKKGDTADAKRHVLQALEEAPRFRDAQKLLLEIEKKSEPEKRASVSAQ